jgi:hypothetical protein
MGLPVGLSSCPKGQDKSRVAAEELSGLMDAENWLSGSADLKTLDNKLWAVLKDMACQVSQQPGEPEEIPCEGSGRDPPRDIACGDSIVARASQGLRRGIGRPF